MPTKLLKKFLFLHLFFPRDLKMENILLDESKKNIKIVGMKMKCFL